MYIPDRVIERKIKQYDSRLFIKWDSKQQFFSLRRTMEDGREVEITPITESIYEETGERIFTPLDERLIWWIEAADSWKHKDRKEHALNFDRRFKEFNQKLAIQKRTDSRDRAKDMWHAVNNFYTSRPQKKNSKTAKFNQHRPINKWIHPDVQSRSNPRVFYRSRANALAYNYKKP